MESIINTTKCDTATYLLKAHIQSINITTETNTHLSWLIDNEFITMAGITTKHTHIIIALIFKKKYQTKLTICLN